MMDRMNRVLSLLLAAGTLCGFTSCHEQAGPAAGEEKVLNIYNWADYIAPDTISNFEKEYGIKVNYDLYDSTEVVEAKLLCCSWRRSG